MLHLGFHSWSDAILIRNPFLKLCEGHSWKDELSLLGTCCCQDVRLFLSYKDARKYSCFYFKQPKLHFISGPSKKSEKC